MWKESFCYLHFHYQIIIYLFPQTVSKPSKQFLGGGKFLHLYSSAQCLTLCNILPVGKAGEELWTSKVQDHSGKAADTEKKHGRNACTHQSELLVVGDFVAQHQFVVPLSPGIALGCLTLPPYLLCRAGCRQILLSCLLGGHHAAVCRKTEFASAKVLPESPQKEKKASSGKRTVQHLQWLPQLLCAQPSSPNVIAVILMLFVIYTDLVYGS